MVVLCLGFRHMKLGMADKCPTESCVVGKGSLVPVRRGMKKISTIASNEEKHFSPVIKLVEVASQVGDVAVESDVLRSSHFVFCVGDEVRAVDPGQVEGLLLLNAADCKPLGDRTLVLGVAAGEGRNSVVHDGGIEPQEFKQSWCCKSCGGLLIKNSVAPHHLGRLPGGSHVDKQSLAVALGVLVGANPCAEARCLHWFFLISLRRLLYW